MILKILNNVLSYVIKGICLIFIGISLYFLYDSYVVISAASANTLNRFKEMLYTEEGDVSFDELREINPDVIGWLTLDDTPIDYPVLQGTTDFSYLNRDFEGNPSLTGSLYTRQTPDSQYSIIYGHHMSDGSMLGSIDYYTDKTYFSEHLTGTYITETKTYSVRVLAIEEADAYDALYSDPSKILNTEVLLGEKPVNSDKLLILSTCAEGTARRLLICKIY